MTPGPKLPHKVVLLQVKSAHINSAGATDLPTTTQQPKINILIAPKTAMARLLVASGGSKKSALKSKLVRFVAKGGARGVVRNNVLWRILIMIFGLSLIVPNVFYSFSSYTTSIRRRSKNVMAMDDRAIKRRAFQVKNNQPTEL